MIYRALLEDDFDKLPATLRTFHSASGTRCAIGTGTVRRDSALLAWLVGFPPAGDITLRLDVTATEDEETWTRWFGDAQRRSTQRVQRGLLMETAGPVTIGFRLCACENGMQFESRGVHLWGIPVPLRIEASTRSCGSSWEVEVKIAHIGSYHAVMRLKT